MSKEESNFKIIQFNGDRFIAVDPDTGEVIEDGNGYGYKTKQNAIKAAYWHFNKGQITHENKVVEKFMKEHKSFGTWISDEMFYSMKDGEDFTAERLKQMAEEQELELPFPPAKFLKILCRKSCKW